MGEDYNGSQGQQRAVEEEKGKEEEDEEEGEMKENKKKNKSDRIFFILYLKMELAGATETSVDFCHIARCRIIP